MPGRKSLQPKAPPARRAGPADLRLRGQGSLTLAVDGHDLAGEARMGLLRAVAGQGSITRAAQAFGISYKAAWDAIDAMNRLAGRPLVARASGGRGGGSTRLTEHGARLLERYEQVAAVHQRFLALLDAGAMDLDHDFSLLQVVNMKTSARNQWTGHIRAIRAGAVNDELELELPGGARIVAIVTHESTRALNLQVQQAVVALVKSSAVVLATGLGEARVSARNRLDGVVEAVKPGAVNAEVLVRATGGTPVVGIVSSAAVAELGLAAGVPVTALVKASDVILATAA